MILEVKDVSVCYSLKILKGVSVRRTLLNKKKSENTELIAVKGISFELDEGDILGVIGRNGAGKSTLLKAIAGTVPVKSGSIICKGNVVALLELGLGFDRELTVRENIYLRAALLGFSKEYLALNYDNILNFSELNQYENYPLRTLSTGMKARLAFAIASIAKPEILILDEVFSVGDSSFKAKSQLQMKKMIENGAVTILVSHSLNQIRNTCNKALWIEKGTMMSFGDVTTVCEEYTKFIESQAK